MKGGGKKKEEKRRYIISSLAEPTIISQRPLHSEGKIGREGYLGGPGERGRSIEGRERSVKNRGSGKGKRRNTTGGGLRLGD